MKRSKYTEEQFINDDKSSTSIVEVFSKLDLIPAGGNYKTYHSKIKTLQIDTSHFTGQGHLKGKSHSWSPKIPLKEILIENSTYKSSELKNRLIKELNWENKCSIQTCGISSWQGNEIVLHLDHINGINTDNRIENLRLLCPNCHSQTETYCAKNKKLFLEKKEFFCLHCNKQLREKRKTGMCIKCCKLVGMVGLEPTSPTGGTF